MALPTIGERYGPAMEIRGQAEADRYFKELVRWQMQEGGLDQAEAERIERANLGYYAGYYDNETRARIERLYSCSHPVFGPIAERGAPDPAEVVRLGMAAGKRGKLPHTTWTKPRSRYQRMLEDDE